MKMRTVREEHQMARASALATVESMGSASLKDVMARQGLCEIRAKRALEELVAMGRLGKMRIRTGYLYWAKRGFPTFPYI